MLRRVLLGAGWLLPLLLAVLFLVRGRHYDPRFFEPPAIAAAALPFPEAIENWTVEGVLVLPADRMFEKINGKADYYLQYGAVELSCGEWVAGDRRWDMYLYRFSENQGARGAYNGERPSDGRAVDGIEGYTVPGQAAMVAGAFYLQLNAQTAGADPQEAAALARGLAQYVAGTVDQEEPEADVGLDMLAGDELAGEGEGFLPEAAFGFSSLNEVRMVEVLLNGTPAVWFTAAGDADTVKAFAEELEMYGGEDLFTQDGGSGGSMFGSWEIVGWLDGAVWGIHAAPSKEALMLHWATLKSRVEEL